MHGAPGSAPLLCVRAVSTLLSRELRRREQGTAMITAQYAVCSLSVAWCAGLLRNADKDLARVSRASEDSPSRTVNPPGSEL